MRASATEHKKISSDDLQTASGIAVVENALSGGIDLAGLFPRFFTLRRGGYLTLLLAFVRIPSL